MSIKVIVIRSRGSSLEYYPESIADGILFAHLEPGDHTPPCPVIGLYPVMIDLYDDRSLMNLELMIRQPSWEVSPHLGAPAANCKGKVIIEEGDATSGTRLWVNPHRNLFFIEVEGVPTSSLTHVQASAQLIVSIGADDTLAGLWLLDVPAEAIKAALTASRSEGVLGEPDP